MIGVNKEKVIKMTDPSTNIGTVLKRVRTERGLTLEGTSELTGVSKAMLGQIERGESNPTISTLWKISTGLKLSFSELLEPKGEEHLGVVNFEDQDPVLESEGKMMLYNVFPFNPVSGFEYFYIKLLPSAFHKSSPHSRSSREYIVVTKGRLIVQVDDESYQIKAPAAFSFKADREHSYSNPFVEPVEFQNIIKY